MPRSDAKPLIERTDIEGRQRVSQIPRIFGLSVNHGHPLMALGMIILQRHFNECAGSMNR